MLIISILAFASIGFIQSALSSVTREVVNVWRNESRNGNVKLEELLRKADQSGSAFSILKTLSLAICLISANIQFSKDVSLGWNNALIITTISLIVMGIVETIIRTLTRPNGPNIAIKVFSFATFVGVMLSPLTRSQERIIEIGASQSEGDSPNTNGTDSITMHLDDQGEPLEEHEVRMIRGVFQLDKTVAREIMIPRVDMTSADINTTLDQVAAIMLQSGHSKIPVYKSELDRIEGIAHSLDILRFLPDNANPTPVSLGQCLRPVLYVPESKTLEDLLTDFQEKRMQMAIVIDEYGGVSGLVTVEDLVEEIVGEIHDEFDRGGPELRKVSESEYYMDASMDIDDISTKLGVSFEGDGFDTIGGFVLHELGKIPSPGDHFEYNGISIEVISTSGRRLKSIRIRTKLK
jgi:putative hemolysin